MRFNRIRSIEKRIPSSQKIGHFFRGFFTTEKLLPLTLEDICQVCPAANGRGNNNNPEIHEKVSQCRKRYFAALLYSFLGKPGGQESDWLYSYLEKCEGCYLHRFTGAEDAGVSLETSGLDAGEVLPNETPAGQKTTRDN